MPDPLPGDEDRQLHVQLQLAHLERRGVPHAHQVIDQAAIGADLPGAAAIGDARGLHDRGIVAHVVDHAHEAAIEHRQGLVEDLLERRRHRAPGRRRLLAQGVDLALLLGTEARRGGLPVRSLVGRRIPAF